MKDKVKEKNTENIKGTREVPFYKIIENTNLAVDGFCYGDLKHVKYYLLSHFHSDHYQGEHFYCNLDSRQLTLIFPLTHLSFRTVPSLETTNSV